jgi:hypothetical protein
MKNMRFFVMLLWALAWCSFSAAQTLKPMNSNAKVYPDSSGVFVYVKNVTLNFIFTGYGVYVPEDYPSVTSVPLENGERINFDNIIQMVLRPKRVYWKKIMEPSQQHQLGEIGPDGYRYWSQVETEIFLKTCDGATINSRIQRPDYSDLFICGLTDRGDFKLQIDQENGKTVRIEFEPVFIMQCNKDLGHLYPNKHWKFCPLCGAPLRRINKPVTH